MAELDLSGRVGFVTGGTRGIGLATAKLLASHGAALAISSRNDPGRAAGIAAELASTFDVEVLGLACDSTEPEQIRHAYKEIKNSFGRLDLLVNNAGILDDALIGMITDEMVQRTLAVNTAGPLLHVQSAARLMRRTKGGSIINLSSIIGVNGNEGQMAYSASKAALIGLTKSAAKELATQQIRVNALAPGFIDTDMTRALPEEKFEERLASVRMGRVGTPEDVANAVLFLSSDLSKYITGQVIGVDGGMLI